MNIKEQ